MTRSQEGLIDWLNGYLDDKLTPEQITRIEKEVKSRLKDEKEKITLDDLIEHNRKQTIARCGFQVKNPFGIKSENPFAVFGHDIP